MVTIDNIIESIESAIEMVVNQYNEPTGLYEPIKYALLQKGKRIRPSLAYIATQLFNGNIQLVKKPAVAIEIFHNFTLLHDDIIDNAPLRRGKETVFKKWNLNTAILSGDTMFAMAYGLLSDNANNNLHKLMDVFTKTAIEVCEGQQYDIDFEVNNSVDISNYFEMIRLKTAVLIAASLKIGAIIANASNEDTDLIYKYGEHIGLAFQLQDDLLDAFGDEKLFGKKTFNDIITNKKTILFLSAINKASEEDKELLNTLYKYDYKGNSANKIEKVIDIYKKYEINKDINSLINSYFIRSEEYLNNISVENSNKNQLRGFTNTLLNRNR